MSNDLLERVTAEIHKTGFPLELRVASFLRGVDYHVATNTYFVDKDEEKGREVDIRALKNQFLGGRAAVRHCLLIECKKSASRPWVFFTSEAESYDQTLSAVICKGVNTEQWIRDFDEATELQERHPWFRETERGRSFFEPFSSGSVEGNTNIQKAVLGAIKALLEAHDTNFAASYIRYSNAIFYCPMVVLEGDLFIAKLSNSQLVVTPADQVLVSVHYRSSKYQEEGKHTVLVVRESAFERAIVALDDFLVYVAEQFNARPSCFAFPQHPPKAKRRRRQTSKRSRKPDIRRRRS
jgi:hypothetical protein